MSIVVEPMTEADWDAVRAIYEEGVAGGDATFERAAPDFAHWDRTHLVGCRIVARGSGGVLGWAALAPVSARPVYAGVAEVSVYIAESARGRGVGTTLLKELVAGSEREGIWTLQAGIFPENAVSIALHLRCGFRILGTHSKLGRMGNRWRDVVLMERRSPAL